MPPAFYIPMEEILHKIKGFQLLDKSTKRRVMAKVLDAMTYLSRNEESRSFDIYAFTEKCKRIVASTNGKWLLIYPPTAKRKVIYKVSWAIIGDLGVFGETAFGKPFLFPRYAKGPGKVLAIVWQGNVYHRRGEYTRRYK